MALSSTAAPSAFTFTDTEGRQRSLRICILQPFHKIEARLGFELWLDNCPTQSVDGTDAHTELVEQGVLQRGPQDLTLEFACAWLKAVKLQTEERSPPDLTLFVVPTVSLLQNAKQPWF